MGVNWRIKEHPSSRLRNEEYCQLIVGIRHPQTILMGEKWDNLLIDS